MRSDTTLRPPKPPRGLILGTGEDVPRGQSLRARLLVLEVGPRDVSWDKLTQAQEDAAAGLLAGAMAGYVQWLAPKYGTERARLDARVLQLRQAAVGSASHRKTPMMIANLGVGIERFLEFACRSGAIGAPEAQELWEQAWAALGEAGEAQAQYLVSAEPMARFLDLLRAALASGEAHLADPEGKHPPSPESWGWRSRLIGVGEDVDKRWEPQGKRIGWLDGDDVYLEPEAAFAAAQRLGQASGDPLAVGLRTLEQRLHDRGLLATVDAAKGRGRLRVRVRGLEGKRRPVLHLLASSISPEVDPPDPPDPRPTPPSSAMVGVGPENGSGSAPSEQRAGPTKGTHPAISELDSEPMGPVGSMGPVVGGRTGQENRKSAGPPKCRTCGSSDWWSRADGGLVCAVCHPKPASPEMPAKAELSSDCPPGHEAEPEDADH
jgi:hypothetical protein